MDAGDIEFEFDGTIEVEIHQEPTDFMVQKSARKVLRKLKSDEYKLSQEKIDEEDEEVEKDDEVEEVEEIIEENDKPENLENENYNDDDDDDDVKDLEDEIDDILQDPIESTVDEEINEIVNDEQDEKNTVSDVESKEEIENELEIPKYDDDEVKKLDDETFLSPEVETPTAEKSKSEEKLTPNEIDEIDQLIDYEYDYENDDDDFKSTTFDLIDDDSQVFDFELIHRVVSDIPMGQVKKYKNGTKKSMSFTNERMREIERHNKILLQKILNKQKSTTNSTKHQLFRASTSSSLQNRSRISVSPTVRVSSATINRQKKQQQIDLENQILKRKLDKIYNKKVGGTLF